MLIFPNSGNRFIDLKSLDTLGLYSNLNHPKKLISEKLPWANRGRDSVFIAYNIFSLVYFMQLFVFYAWEQDARLNRKPRSNP